MNAYTVRGQFRSREGWKTFETSVEAPNEDVAEERAYANFGGRHGLKRTHVRVEEVEA